MSGEPHISDATLAALAARGWIVKGLSASKLYRGAAPAGQMSDGSRATVVAFDPSGRWLESFDGWRTVYSIDSRDWIGRPEALADEVEKRATSTETKGI